MTALDKVKAFFKRPKSEAEGAEKKTAPETKAAEAPKRRQRKAAQSK